ncbi:MAG TPA: LysE family transporter [Desulfosarcina sp.]|nr:LysE family transporter [Desulfosarcina sp.]
MQSPFFIKGLIFGFSIAAPVGPIGILCIRRSLAGGWPAGLSTGMGAATADGLYGCVAAFGLAGLAGLLVDQRDWIHLLGGLFLCYLGLRIFFGTKDAQAATGPPSQNSTRGYLAALLLTLTNPMTILSFTAVFAGMGLGGAHTGRLDAAWLVAGVVAGSMLWWMILSTASSLFRTRVDAGVMRWINRISGTVLAGFGVTSLIQRFW